MEIFSYFCSRNAKSNTMTTITLSYNERNKTAQAVVKFLESLGVFKILKEDEPNATTIKAIEEVKSGKTYKASSLQDMLNYLRLLETALGILASTGTLPYDPYLTHPLKGKYKDNLEAHLRPDMLLIWFEKRGDTIKLIRVGSHSKLFKK